jgi:sulfite dehydrogenase (quinone) subunit SoeC
VHPAPSIIAFTTFSGIGYGLLVWIGVLAPLRVLPLGRSFAAASLGLALAFITAALLSSTLHLGHPERAWRAFSQWRSSWLSREGVSAVATYVPALLFAALWLRDTTNGLWTALGLLAAAGAIATLICTAMIYQSLKPIRQWHNPWVLPNYLMLAAMTGALWMLAMLSAFAALPPVLLVLGAALVLAALAGKVAYWQSVQRSPTGPTLASATGLSAGKPLRPLDPPHTEENYLLKEMGYRIARAHAHKLRRIALALGFAVPLLMLAVAFLVRDGMITALILFAGAFASTAGILIERWLFFAEATHTVALYYRGDARAV